MREKLRNIYYRSSLASKIRYSYFVLLVPFVIFLGFCIYNLWAVNNNYEDMILSTVVASEFSLDFKKDFDYETYLLIVGNKTLEESTLETMLAEANRIVDGLGSLTDSEENRKRLESVQKYLSNLEIYAERIKTNLLEGNRYEDNIEIWENDVQIVTSLLRESIFQYLYYEIQDIQESHTEYKNFFLAMISYSVLAFGAILIMIIVLSYLIPRSITKPIRRLAEVTDQVAKGDLAVRSSVRAGMEVNLLSDSMNSMIDKINELLDQVTAEQIRLRKAEFELLQSQINPHFLYNTLDAIVWLAEAGEQKKVVSMVGSLSEFFRSSLNQGKDVVSVSEEMMHVRSYLEIQQVRYQDILEYELQIPEELMEYQIPKITIQPLVENALYHGIKNKRGVGKILVTGYLQGNVFCLQIEDNGIGITPERLEQVRCNIKRQEADGKGSYALYNVNERIRLNFGEEYGITIDSVYGKGTVVAVILPCIEKEQMV
ncbi:MAG: sensor histidine kinase [Lachnospiraceae bacterium]|nr:sensor histidine kinase [Lachnospiraceae bacterium]